MHSVTSAGCNRDGLSTKGAGHFGHKTFRHRDNSALLSKFKTNHRWSCVSSELSWDEVSWLILDHGTRVEVSRTTFLVSKYLEFGAEVTQSVLMPKCLVAEVSGNLRMHAEASAARPVSANGTSLGFYRATLCVARSLGS